MTVQDSDMALAVKDVDALIDNSQKMLTYLVPDANIARTRRIAADLEAYKAHLLKVQNIHKAIHESYAKNFVSLAEEMGTILGKTLINAAKAGNNQATIHRK